MPDKNELKEQLKKKLDLSIPKVVQPQQLDEAADRLIKSATVDRTLLEVVGKDVFGDKEIFSRTDIDDVTDILNQIKRS